jgi:hypothetical protein
MELKFNSFVVFDYHNNVGAEFRIGDNVIKVQITPEDEVEMRAIIFAAYERERKTLAEAILTAQPLQLEPPKHDYAEFEEVRCTDEDDRPF